MAGYQGSLSTQITLISCPSLALRSHPATETRHIMAPTMEKLANLLEFAMCFDKIKVSDNEIAWIL